MTENNGYVKPVTETVRALAGTPMLLVLVVLNVMILGMLTYLIKSRQEQIKEERTDILQTLENCISKLHDGRP